MLVQIVSLYALKVYGRPGFSSNHSEPRFKLVVISFITGTFPPPPEKGPIFLVPQDRLDSPMSCIVRATILRLFFPLGSFFKSSVFRSSLYFLYHANSNIP